MIYKKTFMAPLDDLLSDDLLFVEIETTGLSKFRHVVSTVSVAEQRECKLYTRQWIASTPDDEGQLLAIVLPLLRDRRLVLFHSAFLLPFLEARAERYGLNLSFASIYDIREGFSEIKSFYPIPHRTRKEIADHLELPLPVEPNGEDVARLTRRLYKEYDPQLMDRITTHNRLHIEALYGMYVFLQRWRNYLTRTIGSVSFRLLNITVKQDILTARFSGSPIQPVYLEEGPVALSTLNDGTILRVEIQEGMITETMPCLFVDITDFPHLSDTTGFRVPKGVLLIQVDDRFLPESILDLLEAILPIV